MLVVSLAQDAVFFARLEDVAAAKKMARERPNGTFAATGKPEFKYSVPFVLIAEVKDGKIVREQTVWNQLEVFTLWGILPVPA